MGVSIISIFVRIAEWLFISHWFICCGQLAPSQVISIFSQLLLNNNKTYVFFQYLPHATEQTLSRKVCISAIYLYFSHSLQTTVVL
jgi:hypothetical protein